MYPYTWSIWVFSHVTKTNGFSRRQCWLKPSLRLYNLGSENTALTLLLWTLCGSVDGSEILRSPVEVDSLSHYLLYKVLYIPGGCLGFLPSTVPQKRNDWNWTAGDLELRMPILMCEA